MCVHTHKGHSYYIYKLSKLGKNKFQWMYQEANHVHPIIEILVNNKKDYGYMKKFNCISNMWHWEKEDA